jgi:phosphoribosylamine--glycine ligase
MNILVIGSGGREHALAWKLSESKQVKALYCAPGNPGMASVAENIGLEVDDIEGLLSFALEKEIDLTVVGPEYPLTLGIVDAFRKEGLRVFGPTKEAARIEGSKAFAKEVMLKAGIPTAAYGELSSKSAALDYLSANPGPIVVKIDGLAAGKGVYVCPSQEEAIGAVEEIYSEDEHARVVIEEFLPGKEASYIVAVSGTNIIPMASSHDYKRIYNNDEGPNTGGMGTVSPTPNLTAAQELWALENVMRPAITALESMGIRYSGFLYAGLMIAPSGEIKVLEFNARMGDPEGQVILRRMNGDLAELLYAMSNPDMDESVSTENSWDPRSAVCVVLASDGYPKSPRKGDEIVGIDQVDGQNSCIVFHAGTSLSSTGNIQTAGGRVLNVTCLGSDTEEAREKVYSAIHQIEFRGMQFRTDIAAK